MIKNKLFDVTVMFSDGTSQILTELDYDRMLIAVEHIGVYFVTATVKMLD